LVGVVVATGISETTAQADARAALIAAATIALADESDVDIGRGFRWPIVSRDWVFATETESSIDTANIAPRRTLNEQVTLHLSIGSWRPGGDQEAEDAAFNQAFSLLGRIQEHVRTNDITLGGTVLWCVPGSSSSAGATTSDESGDGRITEIAATFVCQHRIATA
jgi:hypothetical protein